MHTEVPLYYVHSASITMSSFRNKTTTHAQQISESVKQLMHCISNLNLNSAIFRKVVHYQTLIKVKSVWLVYRKRQCRKRCNWWTVLSCAVIVRAYRKLCINGKTNKCPASVVSPVAHSFRTGVLCIICFDRRAKTSEIISSGDPYSVPQHIVPHVLLRKSLSSW